MASRSEETLVGGNTKTIDLRIRMLNSTRADSRESLPETRKGRLLAKDHFEAETRRNLPNCMVVTSCENTIIVSILLRKSSNQ
jgi:hypothetical protein